MVHDSLRAYELVAIADGRTTVEAVRQKVNESYARNKHSPMSSEKHQPTDSVGKNVKQVVKSVMGRPPVDELQVVTN